MNAKELLDIELMSSINRQIDKLTLIKHKEEVAKCRAERMKRFLALPRVRLDTDPSKYKPKRLSKKKRRRRERLKLKKEKRERNRKRCPQRYQAYINSKFWEERKNRWFQTHKRECTRCGSNTHIHLHHAFYGKYSEEKDEDLVSLCQLCHHEFHELVKTKKNMRKETYEFIEAYKAGIPLKYID